MKSLSVIFPPNGNRVLVWTIFPLTELGPFSVERFHALMEGCSYVSFSFSGVPKTGPGFTPSTKGWLRTAPKTEVTRSREEKKMKHQQTKTNFWSLQRRGVLQSLKWHIHKGHLSGSIPCPWCCRPIRESCLSVSLSLCSLVSGARFA